MDLKQELINKSEIYNTSKELIESGHTFYLEDLFNHVNFRFCDEDNELTDILTGQINNNIKIAVKYDNFNKFKHSSPDYIFHISCLTDGSLAFERFTVLDCIRSIVGSMPKNLEYQVSNFSYIEYIIGNAFMTHECGNFGTKEKPWLQERITCYIPVKFIYMLKEDK